MLPEIPTEAPTAESVEAGVAGSVFTGVDETCAVVDSPQCSATGRRNRISVPNPVHNVMPSGLLSQYIACDETLSVGLKSYGTEFCQGEVSLNILRVIK